MELSAVAARRQARLAGLLYLVSITARMVVEIAARRRLIVADDAAATAANLLAHPGLFRLGFAADLVAFATFLGFIALVHDLVRPLSAGLARCALLFGTVSVAVHAVTAFLHLAALRVLERPEALGIGADSVPALAHLLLRLRSIGFHNVGLVFLGLYLLAIGILVCRARFLPRALGLLVAAAGAAYLPYVEPEIAAVVVSWVLIPAAIGQFALALWLLLFGLDARRWPERPPLAAA